MPAWVDQLAGHWPTKNPAEIVTLAAGTTLFALPKVGVATITLGEVLALYNYDPQLANYLCTTAWGVTVPAMLAKLYTERKAIKRMFFGDERTRGIHFGPMFVSEVDFWTHIFITGMTGSGKSATAIIPPLEQFLTTYCDEDADRSSKNPFKKAGMFVLEVKGTFFEYIVYLVHQAGRNSSRDVILFRPDPRLPLARFKDEKGRFWFLNALSHTWVDKVTSSEAHQLYAKMRRKNGDIYPPTLFEEGDETEPMWDELRKIEVPVTQDMRFVGWRWHGNKLLRVTHTPERDRAEPLKKDGKRVYAEPPTKLTFVDVTYFNNGLRTNLIKPNLPVSEAAARLNIITKLAKGQEGSGGKGGNDFFYEAAEKQMQNCIALHRAVKGKEKIQTTVIDIVSLTTNEKLLDAYLQEVSTKAAVLEKELALVPDPTTRQMRLDREHKPLIDLLNYFNNEWKRHQQGEGKVANSVNSVITNAFNRFATDPNLRESYCSPQTLDHRRIFNDGAIMCYVPGRKYETQIKVLAADIKMDVISTALARKALGLEMIRPVVILNDECHENIISHDTMGDNKALSQLREFRTFYWNATQSDAWVEVTIGREQANVYLSSYGVRVWLQGTDESTNKRASVMCGTYKEEDRKVSQNVNVGGFLLGEGVSAKQDFGYKDKPFIKPEDFGFLSKGEAVIWNRGEDGKDNQVKRGMLPFTFCTSEEGHAAVGDRLRHYFRETLENVAHESGLTYRLDHEQEQSEGTATVEKTAPASTVPLKSDKPFASSGRVKPESADEPAPAGAKPPDAEPEEKYKPAPLPPISRATPAPAPAPQDIPAATPQPSTFPGSTTKTKTEIAREVAEFNAARIRFDAYLDKLKYVPVLNHKLFIEETKEKLQRKTGSTRGLGDRLAVGQHGALLGATDVAQKAAPDIAVQQAMHAPDLSELATRESKTLDAIKAAAALASGASAKSGEPERTGAEPVQRPKTKRVV